jgi:hypothetical protein
MLQNSIGGQHIVVTKWLGMIVGIILTSPIICSIIATTKLALGSHGQALTGSTSAIDPCRQCE